MIGTVSKKLNLKKSQARLEASAGSGHSAPFENGGGFTISEIEDGKRSVAKHLRGRRASANVLFVPKKLEAPTENPDEEIENNFGNGNNHDHLLDPGYASERPLFLQVNLQLTYLHTLDYQTSVAYQLTVALGKFQVK